MPSLIAYSQTNPNHTPNTPESPSNPPSASSESESESDVYQAEALEASKLGYNHAGKLRKFYLVRWAGSWPEGQKRTWEEKADISDDLIDEFEESEAEKKEEQRKEADERARRRDPDYRPGR